MKAGKKGIQAIFHNSACLLFASPHTIFLKSRKGNSKTQLYTRFAKGEQGELILEQLDELKVEAPLTKEELATPEGKAKQLEMLTETGKVKETLIQATKEKVEDVKVTLSQEPSDALLQKVGAVVDEIKGYEKGSSVEVGRTIENILRDAIINPVSAALSYKQVGNHEASRRTAEKAVKIADRIKESVPELAKDVDRLMEGLVEATVPEVVAKPIKEEMPFQEVKGGRTMKAMYRAALMVAAFVFLLPLSARSEIKAGSFEVSPFGGYNFFENKQNLKDRPIFGGRLGYNFTPHWGIEGVGEYIRTSVADRARTGITEGQFGSPMDKVDLTFYHLDAVYHFIPDGKFNPFVLAGFGGAHYRPEISTKDMAAFNLGVGAKYWLTDNIALRFDLKDYMVTEIFQETYHNIGATIGITFAFGGKAKPAPTPAAKYEPIPEPKPEPKPVTEAKPIPKAEEPVVILVPEPKVEPKAEEKVIAKAAPKKVIFSADALFDFDKSTVKPAGKKALDKFAADLKGANFDVITVTGYTDRIGSHAYNMKLSTRRAEAVKAYLVESAGIPAGKITTKGVDGANPVTKPGECKGKQATKKLIACLGPDRRVEVEVVATRTSK
ncbi:MAG: outer membrane beta-barrel domain-containing protein [Thermodesulfovibrionales bacterium]